VTTSPQVSALGRVPARNWYARAALDVAHDLLNAYVTVRSSEGEVTVRLTEVEAYGGSDDPASHAYRGRSGRNAAMFAEPGRLYVYRHMGLHDCVNVVTEPTGQPAAVLLRAGEVVAGVELAWARRTAVGKVDGPRQLARGPGRLATCLGLSLDDNGADVTEAAGRVVVHQRETSAMQVALASGARVGVNGIGGDPHRHPWRLWLAGDPTVSAYRPGYRPASSRKDPGGATVSA